MDDQPEEQQESGPNSELLQEILEIFENIKQTKSPEFSETVLFVVNYSKMYFTCVMYTDGDSAFRDVQKLFFSASLPSLKRAVNLPGSDFKEALKMGIRIALKSLGFESAQVQEIMRSIKNELEAL